MAINKVNTTVDETNFRFLKNQSSIIRTISTNKVTVNGINIVVNEPKVGDIMCVTLYKDESGNLLSADEQKVVWIDGLSIEPTQLSPELETVGICVVVNGNKAIVKYKKEFDNIRWSVGERWELPNLSIMNDRTEHTLEITFGGKTKQFTFNTGSRAEFVNKLNEFCLLHHDNGMYSAELVELDTDEPAKDTSDTMDGNSYRNRIIVNAFFFHHNLIVLL